MHHSKGDLLQSHPAMHRVKKAMLSSFSFPHILPAPQRIEFWAPLTQLLNLSIDLLVIQNGFAIATKFG